MHLILELVDDVRRRAIFSFIGMSFVMMIVPEMTFITCFSQMVDNEFAAIIGKHR